MWAWLRELHELLDERRERQLRCSTCEVLERELAAERREKQQLLQKLLTPPEPEVQKLAPEPQMLPNIRKPWRVKQQELEREDRIKAEQIRKEFEERTEAAEKDLGIKNA